MIFQLPDTLGYLSFDFCRDQSAIQDGSCQLSSTLRPVTFNLPSVKRRIASG